MLDGKNLNGLSLPGIPDQILDIELIFNLSDRSNLLISNRLIGELYADNLNETKVSSYNLFNITYSKKIFNNSEIYLGVNNLFDVNYFDNIRINAFGKRYYEPAKKKFPFWIKLFILTRIFKIFIFFFLCNQCIWTIRVYLCSW